MKINEMLFCIRDAAKQQKLVVFIGAGVSRNSGFKTWREFVSEMDQLINISDLSAKCCYSNDDLLKIPQYLYESAPLQYEELITNEYGKEINASNPIIESLLKLKPNHIVTTNFDNLIEFSLDHSNLVDTPIHGDLSRYVKITKDVDFVNAKRNRFFIKMHGDTDNMEQLVLKEEDYLQYSHTHRFIETYIKTLAEAANEKSLMSTFIRLFSGVDGCMALREYCEENEIQYRFWNYM